MIEYFIKGILLFLSKYFINSVSSLLLTANLSRTSDYLIFNMTCTYANVHFVHWDSLFQKSINCINKLLSTLTINSLLCFTHSSSTFSQQTCIKSKSLIFVQERNTICLLHLLTVFLWSILLWLYSCRNMTGSLYLDY